jgi:hypothetical protein
MRRKIWLVVGLIVIGVIAARLLYQPSVEFSDMQEAWAGLNELNYTCRSDVHGGQFESGFMASKEKATCGDAAELCKAGPMGPQWKNKVWITRFYPGQSMPTMPDDAATRVWGRVFAYGDGAFLDEIETGLLRQRRLVL